MPNLDDLTNRDYAPEKKGAVEQLTEKEGKADEVIELLSRIKKVVKVSPHINGHRVYSHFYIDEECIIVPHEKILKSSVFSTAYYSKFDELPTGQIVKNWYLFLQAIKEEWTIEHICAEEDDNISDAMAFIERMISFKKIEIEDRKEYRKGSLCLFVTKEGYALPTSNVHKIKSALNLKIKHKVLKMLLEQSGHLETIKNLKYNTTNNQTVNCWFFGSQIFNTDLKLCTKKQNQEAVGAQNE